MTDLMKIARLYGQQMGQDVTQSFNDIMTLKMKSNDPR